jgi:hypothetical protein
MARYEGMEDILRRIGLRSGQDAISEARPPRGGSASVELTMERQHYARAVENIVLLMHDAEQLRDSLTTESVHSLTQEEHDELLGMLGKALQELWACELALQRVAPFD